MSATPGKRGMTGRHGNHWRPPLKPRVVIACEVCGKTSEYLPSKAKKISGRFCSRACRGKSTVRNLKTVACDMCSREVVRRIDHLRQQKRAFCSRECAVAGKRVEGAKWRDRQAIREYMRNYLAANRDRHNERSREWSRANRAKKVAASQRWRARLIAATVEPVDYEQIWRRDRGRCHICKEPVRRSLAHFDHVIPLSKGGEHSETNIAVAHGRCNVRKNAFVLTLF